MPRAEIISDLLRRAALTPPDLLALDVGAAIVQAGGNHLVIYVTDYEQQEFVPVALASDLLDDTAPTVPVEGTMAGRAFQHQEVVSAETEAGWRVWAPLCQRAERIGVLELGFEQVDDEVLRLSADLGLLVGHLIHTANRYTDVVELRRRRRTMNLAAEMQWDMLLPPLSFRVPEVAIAGVLEPAYAVAGDGFDYSLNGDVLGFTMLDAMGHGLTSTLASTLALASFRHGRRRGADLPDIARGMDEALVSQFDNEVFVTAHVCCLDTDSGLFSWINAGHPDPLLMRGGRVVRELHCEPCYPLGLGILDPEVGEERLEPGDQLLFYSDGVVEARPDSTDRQQFGLDRLRDHVERHVGQGLPASEVLRRITREVISHRGAQLEDDATLVLLEWRPDY